MGASGCGGLETVGVFVCVSEFVFVCACLSSMSLKLFDQ